MAPEAGLRRTVKDTGPGRHSPGGPSHGAQGLSRQGSGGPDADPIAIVMRADPGRPFVVAQLGQSLDGRIATLSGESRWINGEAALDHLHRLRAAVDAVVVGVGTVAADDPRLDVRRCPGSNPARVVIDPSGRMSPAALVLREDGTRRILVVGEDAELAPGSAEILRIRARAGEGLCPRAVVAALFERGLRRLLVEGGARTISRFVEADALDRLHVLVAPVILGSGRPGLELQPLARLSDALRPRTTAHLMEGGDVLFDCDLRHAQGEDAT
jgi:diaminohydroxyphosphoribosylaminopyrimidine deaminase/5-amino-6-(5-phosphoribosylamino)uracil reductase